MNTDTVRVTPQNSAKNGPFYCQKPVTYSNNNDNDNDNDNDDDDDDDDDNDKYSEVLTPEEGFPILSDKCHTP